MFRNNPEKRKKLQMWSLYALTFAVIFLLQSVLLCRIDVLGVHVDLLPVLTACVAVLCGAEAGGVFALCASLAHAMGGGSHGGVTVVTLTFTAVAAGYLCDAVLHRNMLTAMLMCAMSLLVTFFSVFLVRIYMDGAGAWGVWKCLLQAAISLAPAPAVFLLVKRIRKAGP